MRGLYAIVDVGTLESKGIDPLAFARAVLDAKPAILQLRAKEQVARETLSLLRFLCMAARSAGVLLACNDRADLAVLAGCDLVHVGQTDASPDLVRRIAPNLGIGISTHTPDQLRVALAAHPAYVAYGPVFATATKQNPDPVVGIAGLAHAREIVQRTVPLVAIGGITLDNADEIAKFADMGAVIAGLVPEDGPEFFERVTERASQLHARFGGKAKVARAS
jgi:thiamine-phosphate pyrophosphorylase